MRRKTRKEDMGLSGRMAVLGFLPLACLLAAGPAAADVVYLKGGFQVEGRVVKVERRRILLETLSGLKSIPRARILRIRRKPWLPGEFRDRLERAGKRKDLASLKRLLKWALEPGRKKKLASLLPGLYKRILELDPDDEEARRALGFVRFEGKWVTPEEKARLESEREKAKEERFWEKRAEEKKAGAPYGGKPLEKQIADQAASDRADAFALAGALGVPSVTVLSSRRISIQGFLTREEARLLLELGERALTTWGREIFEDGGFQPFSGRRNKFHFYLVRLRDLPDMVDYAAKAHGGMSRGDRRFYVEWGLGIPPNGWDHYFVLPLERSPLDVKEPFILALARSWAEAAADAKLMPWMPEGFAVEAARRVLGSSPVVKVEFALRGGAYWFADGVRWRWLALTLGKIGKDPSLSSIFPKQDTEITVYDVAKAAGLVEMLWEGDPRDIGRLLRLLGYKHGTQPWAVKQLFNQSPEKVDRLYRVWAARAKR
ncbi:MAG TPA: hypothetical protein ENJ97_06610 [Planctomycetes bacterium]|nr:hypothetical protein [Planctomycetota bacterium]